MIQIMCGEGQGAKDTSHRRGLSLSTNHCGFTVEAYISRPLKKNEIEILNK